MRFVRVATPVAFAAALLLLEHTASATDCTGLELQAVEGGAIVSSRCLEGGGASLPWVDAPAGRTTPEPVPTKPSVTGFRAEPLDALGAQAVEDLTPAGNTAEPEPR